MPVLHHWKLSVWGDEVLARGLVTGHPRLPSGSYCHTSPIQTAQAEEDALTLVTAWGNRYIRGADAIDPGHLEETAKAMERLGLAPDAAEGWARARQEEMARRRARLAQELLPGELLLDVAGTDALAAVFRTAQGELVEVQPYVHLGMVQDSVLVTDWQGGTVDFRYFPKEDRLEPYHLSDGLTAIRLNNLGGTDVSFGAASRAAACPAGEVTVLSASDHAAEGLFSPDAVNGKGLYSKLLTETEDED